jgi:hypothetical protein
MVLANPRDLVCIAHSSSSNMPIWGFPEPHIAYFIYYAGIYYYARSKRHEQGVGSISFLMKNNLETN